jgi:hypothetical protein
MKLTIDQISKIDKTINIKNNNMIVMIDESGNKSISPEERSSNIYCINQDNEIIWKIKELKTKRTMDDDMFVYLKEFPKDTIYAVRFSGFEYNINPETGEATRIGFRKA